MTAHYQIHYTSTSASRPNSEEHAVVIQHLLFLTYEGEKDNDSQLCLHVSYNGRRMEGNVCWATTGRPNVSNQLNYDDAVKTSVAVAMALAAAVAICLAIKTTTCADAARSHIDFIRYANRTSVNVCLQSRTSSINHASLYLNFRPCSYLI